MLKVKFIFDILAAGILLLFLSPVFLILALCIKLDSPGPVFFRQIRAGLDNKPFKIYKFRSMVHEADKDGAVVKVDSPLITRVGKFLRLTSLDELPQLLNILKGEMSLVGPRPLLPGTCLDHEIKRLSFRPGITGLVQIKGRQKLSWDERMNLDLWYVNHWNFWYDVKILFLTIKIFFNRSDVYDADGEMKIRELKR
jgi:lipopolysaccharide/colanic/teichoic acid biosynthesis glycosyltransferase